MYLYLLHYPIVRIVDAYFEHDVLPKSTAACLLGVAVSMAFTVFACILFKWILERKNKKELTC